MRIAKEYEILFPEEPLVIVHLATDGVSSNVAGYYEARCYMIAQHREALLKSGQFNNAVEEILFMAQRRGVLESDSKMLQIYLQ